MKRSKYSILFSFLLLILVIVTLLMDLGSFYNFSDLPFLIAFMLYFWFLLIQRAASKMSFAIAAFLLFLAGLSFVIRGNAFITDRLSAWFYLFFIFGLIQYLVESMRRRKYVRRGVTKPDWDEYYISRTKLDKFHSADRELDANMRWYINILRYIDQRTHIFDPCKITFEIGSGMGGVVRLLSSSGVQITGSDISVKAVRTFNKKFTAPYVVYDVEKPPQEAKRYNQVLAFEILEHVKKPPIAIRNIKRLLKKEGRFVGTSPYPYKHNVNIPTHDNVHYPDYWIKQFKNQGFSSVQTYPMSIPPYLWRIHPRLNIILPFYVPFKYWLSTTLIIAQA